MPELGVPLRDLIDSASVPVSLDVVTSRGRRHRYRRRLMMAGTIAAIVVATAGIAVGELARSPRPSVVANGAEPGTTVATGRAGSTPWVLQVEHDGEHLTVDLRAGAVREQLRTIASRDQLAVISGRSHTARLVYVFGIAPRQTSAIRLTGPHGQNIGTIAAVGDRARYGARFFIATYEPSGPTAIKVEALDTAGGILRTELLTVSLDRDPTKGTIQVIPENGPIGSPNQSRQMEEAPDYIPVTGHGTIDIAGYISKCDLGFCLDQGQALGPNGYGPETVFGPDLHTVVGYEYPGRGFVPLGTDPATVPTFPTRCYGSKGEIPCSTTPLPSSP